MEDSRTFAKVADDLEKWFNNYLKCLPKKYNESFMEKEQEKEIKLLEGCYGEFTISNYIESFRTNYAKKFNTVCLWIINRGFVNLYLKILRCEHPELLLDEPFIFTEDARHE